MELKTKNKKAVFFTMMAIILLSVFLLSFTIYSASQESKVINKRIETMNNFVFSIEKDFHRKMYTSGFRIIFLLEKRIIDTGIPINNVNSSFEECFFNGTIYGQGQELMNGVTFQGISDSLNEIADKANLNISFTPYKLNVAQEDPWHVKISLETGILIIDKNNLALWNKTEIMSAYVPIENFEDPLYVINTDGLVANKITKTIYKSFVSGTDVSNLSLHSANSYYIESNFGPSFLDRLEGKTNASTNGIESLVYLPKLSLQGIFLKDKSVVDYIYFSPNNPGSHNIQGMPSWFKLDDAHLAKYNVTGLAT